MTHKRQSAIISIGINKLHQRMPLILHRETSPIKENKPFANVNRTVLIFEVCHAHIQRRKLHEGQSLFDSICEKYPEMPLIQ